MRISNPPDASNLIASARSQGGYTLASALADLIDNSIEYNAKNIEITSVTDGDLKNLRIIIHDDGDGMDKNTLIQAMRPASQHPDQIRSDDALGRFGWGMKSASISQASKLVVISKQRLTTTLASWDCDDIQDWSMELLEGKAAEEFAFGEPNTHSWTQIQWHHCDRLTEDFKISEVEVDELIAEAVESLELTFHRFLEDVEKPLRIAINGRNLIPADPFLLEKSTLVSDPNETIVYGKRIIKYTAYTLPHFGSLNSETRAKLEGSRGLIGNQGFYVYRNKRLIIHGTWFGITPYRALHQLIRIQLDIPNSLDHLFKITVDKSAAQLPKALKKHLKDLLAGLKSRSEKTIRGPVTTQTKNRTTDAIWALRPGKGQSRLSINRNHAFFQKENYSKDDLDAILDMVETGLPLNLLKRELNTEGSSLCQTPVDEHEIRMKVTNFIDLARSTNPELTPEFLETMLLKMDFLAQSQQLVKEIIEDSFDGC